MEYCGADAKSRAIAFVRLTLADMRPTATTDRLDEGDEQIVDATAHVDERMVRTVHDLRRLRKVRATR